MKKRLLSALLALALVFVLLPTTALADTTPVTDENVKINGSAVTVGNDISLGDGNGTYSYDKSTRTLTLNNATITATGSNIGIDFCDTTNYVTYSVILTGENTVTSNDIAIETTSNTNLTFTGGGNLKAITKGNQHQAIRVYGTLTIDNSTLIAESSAYTATTVIWTLAMTGNNAKLEISNKSAANIVAGTAGPASKNIDWSNYQFTTGSYSGDALTERDPEVCSWGTLNEYLGFPTKKYSQYICIAKRTIPALQRTSDVFIAGEKAVVSQWTNIPAAATGTGSYYYDADKKELTLKDVNITHSDGAIVQFMAGAPYIIKLEGTNSIKDVSSFIRVPEDAYESLDGISVTISGSGSLEVTARSNAITMLKGDLVFNNTGAITLETNTLKGKAINVSGNISIGDDFNKNLRITADNGDMTFDPTNQYTDYNDLKNYKSITIASKPSETYYNGTAMKYGETRNAGSGTISCDENGVITLSGATAGTLEFRSSADSTLVLEGTNTLSSIVTTQKGLTISGSGSLTVGSIRVPNITRHTANLTITGGAAVTAKSNATRAIDIKGDLTVTNGSLTATSTSNNVPTVQVGGNASFTGSTVTITNNSTTQGKSGKNSYEVSTGLYVGGTLDIKNAAKVTSTVIGGNAIYAKGDITISGDSTEVKATNDAYKFSAISTNKTVNISDNSTVKAENLKKHQGDPTGETDPSTGKTYNACPAITGKIANKNTQNNLHIAGFTTSNAGSQNPTEETPLNLDIAPGSVEPYIHHYNVTITRGDKVTRTNSPVVIAGTTLLNDTFYTINGSTVAEGTESNYNAFYNSTTKTLKLNNAQISHSFAHEYGGGQDGAIIFKEFENYFIELSGENTISSTNTYAINCHRPDRTLTIKNAAEAENAKLTLTSNWMVICSIGGLNIQSDVTMVNTKRADYLMYVNGTFSYTGYNAYASTEASGSPLEVYNPQNYSTYKYLRVTKENLAPTTPTIYTVTITAGDNMKRESGALTQEVTKGAAITEVKFMAASGHYFPADYVSKMNLPAGLTAEIRENSWYLIISGTPTSDVTINLPAASVRPTITVSMPTPVAGNTPATASNITLTYSDINKSISKNLTISNVVWQSYVPNGDGSITPGEALSSGDKFEAGKTYFVRITHEYVAGDYDIVPAAGITLDYTESGSTDMMLLFYTTGAPCNHEYTNDWLANGNTHWHECKLCRAHAGEVAHTFGDWITDTPATDTTDGSKHRICSVCQYRENATIPKTGTGEIVPPTPDNPGTIVIIRPAEEEKPAQQPNPSTGANDLVGLAVAAAVAAALGSAALLRKHD